MKRPNLNNAPLVLLALALSALSPACSRGVTCYAPTNPKSDKAQRIISLAPSVTETLFAAGAGDRVVGVTLFCNWPPEVKNLPKVGQFARFDMEKILELHPDMVIASRDAPSETIKYDLARYDILTFIVEAETLEDTVRSIRNIGRAVGTVQKADAVAREMERRIQEIQETVSTISPKVKTILVFGHDPLILAGPGTFADDLIKRAGGINLAHDSRIKYPKYSIERIVLEGPEVIIEATMSLAYDSPDWAAIRDFWNQWPYIPAVKSGRVIVVDADLVTRPGPRIVDGLELIAKALHPEKMQ